MGANRGVRVRCLCALEGGGNVACFEDVSLFQICWGGTVVEESLKFLLGRLGCYRRVSRRSKEGVPWVGLSGGGSAGSRDSLSGNRVSSVCIDRGYGRGY